MDTVSAGCANEKRTGGCLREMGCTSIGGVMVFECVVKGRRVILGLLLTVASTGNK